MTENHKEETQEVEVQEAPLTENRGLMQRRKSFAQNSVPNAHKGYSGKSPKVMLGVICGMVALSLILANLTS